MHADDAARAGRSVDATLRVSSRSEDQVGTLRCWRNPDGRRADAAGDATRFVHVVMVCVSRIACGRDAGPISLPHLDAGLETTSVGLSELGRETTSPESPALGGNGIPLNTASIYALWAAVSTDMLVSCCCAVSPSLRYGRATRPKARSRPASWQTATAAVCWGRLMVGFAHGR
jgi:hypothetical protein